MKKLLFLLPFFLLLLTTVSGQTHRRGHGAANADELGQAVFNALQKNQFNTLTNYLPDEVELRILKRRSSEDMRLLLERTSPDSLRQNLQTNFSYIVSQTTANTFNWQDWQLAGVKTTRRDRKNPLLFSIELSLADAANNQRTILVEALRIRGRFFLFKQMIFHA